MKKIVQLALLAGIINTTTTSHCWQWDGLVPTSRLRNWYNNWQIRQEEIRQFKKLTHNNPLAKEYYWLEEIDKSNNFARKNIESLNEEIKKLDQRIERIRRGERFEKSYDEEEIKRLNAILYPLPETEFTQHRNKIRSDNPYVQKLRLEREIEDYETAINRNVEGKLKLQNKINKQHAILDKYQDLPQIKLRNKRFRQSTGLGWGQE